MNFLDFPLQNSSSETSRRTGTCTQEQQQATAKLCFFLPSLKSMFYCRIFSLLDMLLNLIRNIYYIREVEKLPTHHSFLIKCPPWNHLLWWVIFIRNEHHTTIWVHIFQPLFNMIFLLCNFDTTPECFFYLVVNMNLTTLDKEDVNIKDNKEKSNKNK